MANLSAIMTARPRSHAEAAADLPDTPYLVYVLVQCAKLFLALAAKKWAHLT